VGKMKFSDLEKISTVTARSITEDGGNNNLFQRPSDFLRISKISKFLSERLLDGRGLLKAKENNIVIFPTAIIIALNQVDVDSESEIEWDGSNLEFEEGAYSAFIVDGQHRFLGIKKFYEDNKILSKRDIDIELSVTVLVGYDIWEQSKIFAEVNFSQKPVNKSLYYDIFGSMEDERNKETLAHSLVKYLNYNTDSPFYGLVKMLGTGPGIISQAFLVEKMIKLFASKNAFSIFYDDYKNGKTDQKLLAKTVSIYFNAIKNRFINYYPIKNAEGEYHSAGQHILFKTTGIGAFCRLLKDFEEEIKMKSDDSVYMDKFFSDIFSLVSDEESQELFSKDGLFGGSASEGSQVRLHKKLFDIINYKKDVLGKIYNNGKITGIKLTKDSHGRDLHDLTLDNWTTSRVSSEELANIRLLK